VTPADQLEGVRRPFKFWSFMMITVEIGEPRPSRVCPDCGAEVQTVHGFVYQNGAPFAVYHAAFSRAHYDQGANARIAVGDWSEGADPNTRIPFGLEIRATPTEYQFGFIGPDSSMWGQSELMGPMLTREQALAHPQRDVILHIAEHVVHEDARIYEFLQGA